MRTSDNIVESVEQSQEMIQQPHVASRADLTTIHKLAAQLIHELDDVPWLGAQAVKTRFECEAAKRLSIADVQQTSSLLSNLWHMPDTSALFTVLSRSTCKSLTTSTQP